MARGVMLAALTLWLSWAGLAPAQGVDAGGKPLGRWVRKIDKTQVVLEIEEDRLHIKFTGEKSLTLHADYRLTKDRIVFGMISSVETDEEDSDALERNLVDHVFSFSYRVDEGILSIRDLKCSSEEFKGKSWNGRFKVAEPEKAIRTGSPSSYPTPNVPSGGSQSPARLTPTPAPLPPESALPARP